MADVVFLAVIIVSFGALTALVRGCERIVNSSTESGTAPEEVRR